MSVKTVIMFIEEFSNCLSDIERQRVSQQLETICRLSSKQLTIEEVANNIQVDNLEQEFKTIKTNNSH